MAHAKFNVNVALKAAEYPAHLWWWALCAYFDFDRRPLAIQRMMESQSKWLTKLSKTGGKYMSKARDTQKTEKKKAEKSLKEKRKEKKEKKSKKDRI